MTLCQKRFHAIVLIFLVFGLLIGQAGLVQLLRKWDPPWAEQPQERQTRMNPEVFRTMVFGQAPVAVDWLLMRFVGNTGMGKVPDGTHPGFYYDLELATDLDPAFYEAYHAGASVLAVVRKDAVGARDLLNKATWFLKHDLENYSEEFKKEYWKNPWGIPLLLGYVQLFELHDMPRAAEAFREAAVIPGAPAYLAHFKERLEKPGGQYEVGLRLLKFMVSGARDEKVKEELKSQFANLEVSAYVFEVNQTFGATRRFPERDPWGGRLYLDENQHVRTITPHVAALGLND